MAVETGGRVTESIESRDDYDKTPEGIWQYWEAEINSSEKFLSSWHKFGGKIDLRYKDVRTGQLNSNLYQGGSGTGSAFRLNLFHTNIATLSSMLYGQLPRVDVSRRHQDANDDVGRVAAETMERLLNNDIADNGLELDTVLRSALQDRLIPGLGCARVRYEAEFEDYEHAAVIGIDGEEVQPAVTESRLKNEGCSIDYYYWRDVLWNWSRSWAELDWMGYRSYLTKDEVKARFPDIDADSLTYEQRKVRDDPDLPQDSDTVSAWMKAEIWEIWDRVARKVVWWHRKLDKILDVKDDPLELRGFFPSPPFFIANATTTLYVPTPDYQLAQDLYNEIDKLQTRIAVITEAVKVVGVYDRSAEGVSRMFKEGIENDLIPVDNWAMFAEKGGIQGQVDWFPIEDVVNALDKLRGLRDEQIQLLYQVTGMSDMMRGQLDNQYEGVGQSNQKMQFASIRVQALQDQFAQFASDLMQLKAEIISKHYDPQTIVERSNMQHSMDADLIVPAVQLIKDYDRARLQTVIRPESIAMADFVQLKNERTGYLTAVATFMQSSTGMLEKVPSALPFLLQLLQWGLAGFKGSSEIEGVVDKAIEAALEEEEKRKQQPPPPDPEQIKAQMAQALEQLKHSNKMQQEQAKTQGDMQKRQQDFQLDVKTMMAEMESHIMGVKAEHNAAMEQIAGKMEADVEVSMVDMETNAAQNDANVDGEIRKDVAETSLRITEMAEEHEMDVELERTKAAMRPKPTESNSDD